MSESSDFKITYKLIGARAGTAHLFRFNFGGERHGRVAESLKRPRDRVGRQPVDAQINNSPPLGSALARQVQVEDVRVAILNGSAYPGSAEVFGETEHGYFRRIIDGRIKLQRVEFCDFCVQIFPRFTYYF